jgi:hypothetical protein
MCHVAYLFSTKEKDQVSLGGGKEFANARSEFCNGHILGELSGTPHMPGGVSLDTFLAQLPRTSQRRSSQRTPSRHFGEQGQEEEPGLIASPVAAGPLSIRLLAAM